jgi:outer membrane usher protein FimD/PapC
LFSSGATYLGANSQGDAQIVVDIENESEDGTTIVEIEGGQKTKAVGSKRLIFGVTPYREYKVSISPDDDAPITDYDTKVVDVLLYPGHSQLIRFTLRKLYIALGTLVDEKDNPILNAKIVGAKENSESDEDGLFQVEIAGSETLFAEGDGKKCEIVLTKLESEVEYYHEYGNVPCKSIPNSEP